MWRFESVHSFASVGNLYQKMHFAGSNLSTDPKWCAKRGNASTKFWKTLESKKAEKSLEISAFLVFSCLHLNQTLIMAGIAGLEPASAGVKVLCLTDLAISLWMLTLNIISQFHLYVNCFFIFDIIFKEITVGRIRLRFLICAAEHYVLRYRRIKVKSDSVFLFYESFFLKKI